MKILSMIITINGVVVEVENINAIDNNSTIKLTPFLAAIRRKAIEYFFVGLFGAPVDEDHCDNESIINTCRK